VLLLNFREALERADVEFTNGKEPGVRFGGPKSKGTYATAPAPSTMKTIPGGLVGRDANRCSREVCASAA
jgi:hypothetical protein